MSAAANAAGYLYAHRLLPENAQRQPETGHAEQKNVAQRASPRSIVAQRAAPQPDKQPRTPKIEYRKRRLLLVPETA
jgi:hypothetical protein